MFTAQDLVQISHHGVELSVIEAQIENFKNGFPFVHLVKAATIGDGILKMEEETIQELVDFYEIEKEKMNILKFVPASGAATRMFKSLFEYMAAAKTASPSKNSKEIQTFFENLEKFAFYGSLHAKLEKNADNYVTLETLLLSKGLNYGSLPKGLLEFHRYEDFTRTALEEQMVDGVAYASSKGNVKLHFTVSPEHRQKFEMMVAQTSVKYEKEFNVKFEVSFSEQKSATDTIAVDLENKPFRNENGELLFRPAGHGALLSNLNDLVADLIFIKNIDNVVPDHTKPIMVQYKKALAGLLIKLQKELFRFQKLIDISIVSEANISDTEAFLDEHLNVQLPKNYESYSYVEKITWLKQMLFRPIRVCGMVKNIGEAGGGPFWILNDNSELTIQIIESAQIDLENKKQQDIFAASTHFNPVDLIFTSKNYKGEQYNLFQYRDSKTGFITGKSLNGAMLKAQELPGLWNGSMANWNTVFVEIPLITFNPVKTVNDLLRPEHQ